jgi:hypothetical protein
MQDSHEIVLDVVDANLVVVWRGADAVGDWTRPRDVEQVNVVRKLQLHHCGARG